MSLTIRFKFYKVPRSQYIKRRTVNLKWQVSHFGALVLRTAAVVKWSVMNSLYL